MKLKKLLGIFLVICSSLSVLSACFSKPKYLDWHLNALNIDDLGQYSKGATQIVAFIDTGISQVYAEYLQKRIIFKYNVTDGTENIEDRHGHGTQMTAIVCGYDSLNIIGIAPEAKIIILKAVNDEGKTDNNYLLKALETASANEATVVNISLGGTKTNEQVTAKINEMSANGISIVASAGDYGNRDLLFPASIESVISVEALNEKYSVWKDSNTSEASICRFPGENINTVSISESGQLYAEKRSGTSESTAIASGYIALLKDFYISQNKLLSNEQIKNSLRSLKTKSEKKIDFVSVFKNPN